MKIKLDENLPVRVAIQMKDPGHDVHTAYDEGFIGHPDKGVWEAAQKESRFLITQDLDFSDSRLFAPGSHSGLMLVRLRSPNRRNLVRRIVELFKTERVGEWIGCFVVVTEHKTRVLMPPREEKREQV